MKHLSILLFALLILFVPAFAQTEVESLIKKSEELERENKIPEAIGELTKAIAIDANNADLYLRRAQFYFGENKPDAVLDDVNRAINLKPDDKPTLLTGTRYLRNARKCAESLNLLNAFIFKNQTADDVFYARAHSKMCLDDWVGAYDDMTSAIELAPKNNNYITTQAGLLNRLGDSEKAFQKFADMIAGFEKKLNDTGDRGKQQTIKRDLARVYDMRARIYHTKGDTAAEFADYAKSIEYQNEDMDYANRAKVYFDHRMFEEAIADYTESLRISKNPKNNWIFLIERADAYVYAGKYDEAFKDYAEALKLNQTLKEPIDARIVWAKQKMQDGGVKLK